MKIKQHTLKYPLEYRRKHSKIRNAFWVKMKHNVPNLGDAFKAVFRGRFIAVNIDI